MSIPSKTRQIVVNELGSNFREVTEIITTDVPSPGSKQVLVKNRFVGINASDINFTAGKYDPTKKPPFPVGFEALGEIVSTGPDTKLTVGQSVLVAKYGAFSEYLVVDEAMAVPVPSTDQAFLTFPVSGLTASIALEKEGDLKPGKTVLVTAAAGGTGQFAVQIAKLAGCHVIGTTSSNDKAAFLKSLGCDRTINYREESLDDVLSNEYKKGVDVVYESVGGDTFDTCLKNLAVYGRIIIIGMISTYEDQTASGAISVPRALIKKSASVRGFFLPQYTPDRPTHFHTLTSLYKEGKLKVATDKGEGAATGPFVGLEKVVDAVDYMYSRKNIGKVIVEV